MRTTIEMKPEHRARVMKLAASRGEKGFSAVVAEALDLYLETQESRNDAIRSALSLTGSMKEVEAAGLRAQTGEIRANWRRSSPIRMCSLIFSPARVRQTQSGYCCTGAR